MSRSLDERISLRDRLKVNVHKLMCRACRRYLAQISFIGRAMHIQDDLMLEDAGIPSARSDSDLKAGIRDCMGKDSNSQM